MTGEQERRALAIRRSIRADVAEIKAGLAHAGDRLRALDEMYAAFRTDCQNAQA